MKNKLHFYFYFIFEKSNMAVRRHSYSRPVLAWFPDWELRVGENHLMSHLQIIP